jgi:hypothetical protein
LELALFACAAFHFLLAAVPGASAAAWPTAMLLGGFGAALATFLLVLVVAPPAVVVLPFVLFVGMVIGALWGAAGWAIRRALKPRYSVGGAVALAIAVVTIAATPLGEARVAAAVPWPVPDVHPSIQIRGGDGTFWVEVETPHGRYAQPLWTDWGPARRANLYRTPRGTLVVIGGGWIAAIIELPAAEAPRPGGNGELADGADWTYVGAVAAIRGRDPRFFSPSELRECIPLYGEGRVPVRREFRSVHGFDCDPRRPRGTGD